ncbi:MAG: Coenzyme F420 hydrogenase/dehydrogenase, beta subunit C-terminal domain [Prevotella sp.]|jgi:coenzyme F420-reducing hydrogenase beta subunit|nr:Coenzyme F420 hydrogenase/dehydrogenase, beta subunit C-terminal domain [Prevotella sp.]
MKNDFQNIKSVHFAFASDRNVRYKGSSGGAGTAIINYLFDSNKIQSAVTLQYSNNLQKYEPKIVYNKFDYIQSGSVYHDINIPKYISDNIFKIKGCIAVFCPPCFVNVIRSILKREEIESIIISFACSGQTNIEGTYFYYKCLGINKEDINKLQYRGNGFPSGIQITLKDRTLVYHENYTYPWDIIQQSHLFRPKRCFFCKEVVSEKSDFNIADPWNTEYVTDKDGYTLLTINTDYAKELFNKMKKNYIQSIETNIDVLYKSQFHTFRQKEKVNKNLNFLKKEYKICSSIIYKKIVLSNFLFLRLHNRILAYLSFRLMK